jgi:hypothetical protein
MQPIYFRGHQGWVQGGSLTVGAHRLAPEQVDAAGAAELQLPGLNSVSLQVREADRRACMRPPS